ncbi:hypothetical protein [Streptomyces sp. RTd22]|uniref:hypothetical protein n=1 Tax=Streptomyces sp. RTd22 TaxID=1841249 RepID=UPI0007C5656F|nr:hypothetical protein [Streptomyces sp. RTd22]
MPGRNRILAFAARSATVSLKLVVQIRLLPTSVQAAALEATLRLTVAALLATVLITLTGLDRADA